MGKTMTINVQEVSTNLRPTDLGSSDVTTNYNTPYIYTVDDFILDTIGGTYSDPENDEPFKLKCFDYWDSNDNSKLQYNGIDIFPNLEIPMQDIADGKLIFIPDNSIIIEKNYEGSPYTISDIGSQQYYNGLVKFYIKVNAQ